MKECKHCSSIYEDNLRVCPNCGGTSIVTEEEKVVFIEQEQYEKTAYIDNSHNLRKLIFIGGGALLAIILTITIVISMNNNRVYVVSNTNGQVEITNKEIQSTIDLGNVYLEQENYEAAIKEFRKIPGEHKDYLDVKVQLVKAEGDYKKALLEKTEQYVKEGRTVDALAALEAGKNVLENEVDITAKIFELNKSEILKKIAEFEQDEDYAGAIVYLNKQVAGVNSDSEIVQKLNTFISIYKSEVLEDAEQALNDGSYIDAIDLLQAGLKTLPGDPELIDKVDEYKEYAPVLVSSLTVLSEEINAHWEDRIEYRTDLEGKFYPNAVAFYTSYSDNGHAKKFRLDKKYTEISGTIFVSQATDVSSIGEFVFYIYADDKLIYSCKLSRETEPIAFNVGIDSCEILTIDFGTARDIVNRRLNAIGCAIDNFVVSK